MLKTVRRPLALCAAGSLCAFFLCLFTPSHLILPLIIVSVFLSVALIVLLRRFPRASCLFLASCGLLFGLLWQVGYVSLFMAPARTLVGCKELITATVTEKQSYGFVVRAQAGGHSFKAFLKYYDESAILPGDRLTFAGVFSLPSNSGGFDGERYYLSRGIPVTCTPGDEPTVEKNAVPFYAAYYKIRHGALLYVSRIFGKCDGEMAALLMGEKTALSEKTKNDLTVTGLSHAFVVSGMHLSFVVSMLAFLKGRKGYLWIVLPFSLLFALFSGMGLSVIRAFLMLIYALIAGAFCLPRDHVTELSASLLFILLFNPHALLNAGLIFSYLAVCGLFFLHPRLITFLCTLFAWAKGPVYAVLRAISSAFSVSLSAGIATLPAVVFYMQHFSAVFLFSNLLLLWMVEIIFVLGAVSLIFGFLWIPLGKLLAMPAIWLLSLFLKADAFFASLPFADIGVESMLVTAAMALSAAVIFTVAIRNKPLFRPLPLGIILLSLLSSLLFTELSAMYDSFTLTVLPSKKECALLSAHGRYFLIGYDEAIKDVFVRKNIDYLDYLILPQNGQADEFLLSFPVGEVLQDESASFTVGDTVIDLTPEGNIRVISDGKSVSVLLSPGQIRESDLYLLSREAQKSVLTQSSLQNIPIYTFGTPPRNPDDAIIVEESAYSSGELTFTVSKGRLKVKSS